MVLKTLPLNTRNNEPVRDLQSVVERRGLTRVRAHLAKARMWLRPELDAFEQVLDDARGPHGNLAQRAATHLLAQPGKRIRPICVALGARMGDEVPLDVVAELAAAAELTHTATLLHDDVIDLADTRRGAPSSRVVFGNAASVLAGDHLLMAALRRVDAAGIDGARERLMATIEHMIEAECIQLETHGRFEPDRETYHAIISGKTASLFRWCLEAGGLASGLPSEDVETLGRVGAAIGFAFQIVDDALDIDGDPAVTGKPLGGDIREGKLTWPMIVACERDPMLAVRLREAFSRRATLDDAEVERVRKEIVELGAFDATRERARAFARSAQCELATLPHGEARRALEAVASACVTRLG